MRFAESANWVCTDQPPPLTYHNDTTTINTEYALVGAMQEMLHHNMLQGHPHVVEVLEVIFTHRHVALVMRYATGGDLSQLIGNHVHEKVSAYWRKQTTTHEPCLPNIGFTLTQSPCCQLSVPCNPSLLSVPVSFHSLKSGIPLCQCHLLLQLWSFPDLGPHGLTSAVAPSVHTG